MYVMHIYNIYIHHIYIYTYVHTIHIYIYIYIYGHDLKNVGRNVDIC